MITLNEIVEDLLISEGRDTTHKKKKYLHHAINGFRDMHYDVVGYTNYDKIAVDTSNNTVDLPSDFIREIGVYVIGGDGKLIPLSRNKHRIFKDKDDCGNTINPVTGMMENSQATAIIGNEISQFYRNGQAIGNMFGNYGVQSTGEYNINKQENIIELSTYTSQSYVVLKYMADIQEINGEFMVHPFLRDAIKDFIYWDDKRFSRSVSPSEKRELKRLYTNSKNWVRMRMNSFNYDEAREISKQSFSQSPKY